LKEEHDEGKTRMEVTLTRIESMGGISMVVEDESGSPVQGAECVLRPTPREGDLVIADSMQFAADWLGRRTAWEIDMTTDEGGRASVAMIPLGEWILRSRAGAKCAKKHVTVQLKGHVEVIRLAPGRKLRGTVTIGAPDARPPYPLAIGPIEAADGFDWPADFRKGRAGERFEWLIVPGIDYKLSASVAHSIRAEELISAGQEPVDVVVAFPELTPVSGTARYSDGSPIESGQVNFSDRGKWSTSGWIRDGAYKIEAVSRSARSVHGHRLGKQRQSAHIELSGPPESDQTLTFPLPPPPR
jgi:hypothetical protein